jgi:hypothetical protein
MFSYIDFCSMGSELYLLSIFTHPCVYLVFRYPTGAACMGREIETSFEHTFTEHIVYY